MPEKTIRDLMLEVQMIQQKKQYQVWIAGGLLLTVLSTIPGILVLAKGIMLRGDFVNTRARLEYVNYYRDWAERAQAR